MASDPGIFERQTETNTVDNSTPLAWHQEPRWKKFGGKKPPMTPARAAAIAAKRAFERTAVPLARCLSGDELLAERRHIGDGTSFRLSSRKLRWPDTHLLAAICYAMLSRRAQGLVATLGELGELVGLKATAIGDSLRKLEAWGLVASSPTFTAYGCATSQRANCYRVTQRLVEEFRLLVPDGVVVPAGVVDLAWRPRSRIPGDRARAPASRNPEANPEAPRTQNKNPNPSGMAHAADAPGVEVSTPSTKKFPETRGESPACSGLKRVKARRDALPDRNDGLGLDDDVRELIADLKRSRGWS